jgi:hypothetical protein
MRARAGPSRRLLSYTPSKRVIYIVILEPQSSWRTVKYKITDIAAK